MDRRDDMIQERLDQCLDAVLSDGRDIDSVCAGFPEHEADLRSLLNLALQGRSALAVDVSPVMEATNRKQVMGGIEEISRRRQLEKEVVSIKTKRRFALKPLAWITAVLVLLMSGTALAASNAEPDSFLYPLKQRMEEARTSLAWQSLDKAETEVGHANERLDELAEMVDEGKYEYLPDLLYRFDLHIERAIGYANEAAADGEDVSEIRGMIKEAQQRRDDLMGDIFDEVPAGELEKILTGDDRNGSIHREDHGLASWDSENMDGGSYGRTGDGDSNSAGGYGGGNDDSSSDDGYQSQPGGGGSAPGSGTPDSGDSGNTPGDDGYSPGDNTSGDAPYDGGNTPGDGGDHEETDLGRDDPEED